MGDFIIQGILSFTNIFIAVFVLVFAASFLKKTESHRHRNPWIFLFCAVIIFFFIQILKVFELLGQVDLGGYMFYLDSMFLAVVLFTFVFQYNLILNSELIQITRKKDVDEIKVIVSKRPTKKSKKRSKKAKK